MKKKLYDATLLEATKHMNVQQRFSVIEQPATKHSPLIFSDETLPTIQQRQTSFL